MARYKTAKEMLNEINNRTDLYNPRTGQYVFLYNGCGSIAVYYLSEEEAMRLAKEAKETENYWCGLLGPGGKIYDDPSYEGFYEKSFSNLDYCEEYFNEEGWVTCDEFYEERIVGR